jgi:molybdate transport system substrate-binding protein
MNVKYLFTLCFMMVVLPVNASLKIAVASNFKVTLEEIITLYAHQSDQQILVSSGSTGVLYNQINHGAPFDLFLSADKERAELIEASEYGLKGSRFTYARGKLAFWVPNSDQAVNENTLLTYKGRVAVANAKLAPYGLATQQALETLNLQQNFSYVTGNNISQTYQFIDTGNIEAGFVAQALLLQNKQSHYYLLPSESYQPILQQGVMLSGSSDKQVLQKFVDFLQSKDIQEFIRRQGYL